MLFDKEEQQTAITAFNEAVADMRGMFPAETAKITFVHTQVEGWEEQVTGWLDSIDPGFRAKVIESWANEERRSRGIEIPESTLAKSPEEAAEEFRLALEGTGKSGGFASLDSVTGKGLAVVGMREAGLFSVSSRVETQMTVIHETGHLVVPAGYIHNRDDYFQKDRPLYNLIGQDQEIAADSFTVLCGLHTGSLSREDVIALSFNRSLEYFFCGKTHHLTSLALDRLLLQESDAKIMAMTPKEIKETAHKHAFMNACSAQDHSSHDGSLIYPQIKTKFFQLPDTPFPKQLNERFAAFAKYGHEYSNPDRPVYYVADKILRHIVEVGAVFYPQSFKIDTEGPEWDKIRERLANRPSALTIQAKKWRNEAAPPDRFFKLP